MKNQELEYYNQFAGFLQKYEDTNAKEQAGGDNKNIKLVSGDTKAHLKNKLDELAQELKNPFKHIRNWIKGEMINLGTLISAIGEKDLCEVRKANTLKKLADERDTLEKLNANKFSFKTVFKSKTSKDKTTMQLVANIAQRERDIKNWDEIKRFLVVYIAEIAIPDYKKRKMQNYIGAMQ